MKEAAESAIIRRALCGGPWTREEMSLISFVQSGYQTSEYRRAGRFSDRLIQRWRKMGWITFTRVGQSPYLSLTDAGRAALEEVDEAK